MFDWDELEEVEEEVQQEHAQKGASTPKPVQQNWEDSAVRALTVQKPVGLAASPQRGGAELIVEVEALQDEFQLFAEVERSGSMHLRKDEGKQVVEQRQQLLDVIHDESQLLEHNTSEKPLNQSRLEHCSISSVAVAVEAQRAEGTAVVVPAAAPAVATAALAASLSASPTGATSPGAKLSLSMAAKTEAKAAASALLPDHSPAGATVTSSSAAAWPPSPRQGGSPRQEGATVVEAAAPSLQSSMVTALPPNSVAATCGSGVAAAATMVFAAAAAAARNCGGCAKSAPHGNMRLQ